MSETITERIRLLVVDDHAMFRDAIAEKLGKEADMAVIGACGSAAEALRLLRTSAMPTIILLDYDLGSERVTDFLYEAKAQGFDGKVLVVTAGVSGREAVQLIQAGVHGIIHKHNSPKALCDAIRQIARGDVYLENAYLSSVFHDMDQTRTQEGPHLTERDKSVLRLVLQGLANKEIASRLQVSEGAVKSAISQLFQKLGARTRTQLVKITLEEYSDQI